MRTFRVHWPCVWWHRVSRAVVAAGEDVILSGSRATVPCSGARLPGRTESHIDFGWMPRPRPSRGQSSQSCCSACCVADPQLCTRFTTGEHGSRRNTDTNDSLPSTVPVSKTNGNFYNKFIQNISVLFQVNYKIKVHISVSKKYIFICVIRTLVIINFFITHHLWKMHWIRI